MVVGTYDRSQVGKFKRLVMFAPEDFDTLLGILSRFRHLYITPNVVTEVSNLAGNLSGDVRRACFQVFAETILSSEELIINSRDAAAHFTFAEYGVTDAAIFRVAGDPPLILTVDFPLSQILSAHGLPVAAAVAQFRGKIDLVKRKIESTRIIRGRPPVRDVSGWETASPDERLEAVWDLTLIVMEWTGHGESRLQRSVCRVQRSRR